MALLYLNLSACSDEIAEPGHVQDILDGVLGVDDRQLVVADCLVEGEDRSESGTGQVRDAVHVEGRGLSLAPLYGLGLEAASKQTLRVYMCPNEQNHGNRYVYPSYAFCTNDSVPYTQAIYKNNVLYDPENSARKIPPSDAVLAGDRYAGTTDPTSTSLTGIKNHYDNKKFSAIWARHLGNANLVMVDGHVVSANVQTLLSSNYSVPYYIGRCYRINYVFHKTGVGISGN